MKKASSNSAFITLISVFFFWGFVASSNDILIPVFKEQLNLEQWKSQLISVSFYVAYAIGAIIYFSISRIKGKDILNDIGYKNGIALGLLISAVGTLLFYPAAQTASFNIMITGLFIVGLGFSLQQTAANPLTIHIGDPKRGSQRLSLAGGINNLGTTIGPVLVSFAIFGSTGQSGGELQSLESVKTPYLILGAAFLVVAALFRYSSLPSVIPNETGDKEYSGADTRSGAIHYPQLWMGMIGIFVYVGVEVSTASNLPEFMRVHLNTPTDKIAPYISLFWASLMVGRWKSAVGAFELKSTTRKILHLVLPYGAFAAFMLVSFFGNHDLEPFYLYPLLILAVIIADIASKGNPAKQLLIYSTLGIASLLTGMMTSGMVSVYAFISVGLFCSTLWPCIFTLAIAGLGKHTNEGSGLLIMMIMGGGLISLLQGVLASENLLGIRWSYLVGVACFLYLAFYAWRVKHILKSQHYSMTDEK